jgi:hypothetical protein
MNANSLTVAAAVWAVGVISVSTLRADVPAPEQPPAPAATEQGKPADAAAPAPQLGNAPAAEAEKPAVAPARSVYDQAFDKVIDKAQNGWLEDPFKHIEGDMSHVVGELTAFKTDKPVQQVQDKVTTRLDALIKQLDKECNSGGGGGGGGKPLGRSILAKGPGGQGAMHDPKAGDKQWASLPPKQREQILQSRTEGFPPGFESLLQSYYQRLAQEQVGGDDAQPAPAGEGDAAPASGDAGERPAAAADQGAQ